MAMSSTNKDGRVQPDEPVVIPAENNQEKGLNECEQKESDKKPGFVVEIGFINEEN